VDKVKEQFKGQFDCEKVGKLKEYIGCKVDINMTKQWMKLTQLVLLQSFTDKFEQHEGECPKTPAIPCDVLQSEKGKSGHDFGPMPLSKRCWEITPHDALDSTRYLEYCTGIKLIYEWHIIGTHESYVSYNEILYRDSTLQIGTKSKQVQMEVQILSL
jgi:hypothetical protein